MRVTIEIVPYGEEAKAYTIAELNFALDPESPLPAVGHYNVEVSELKFNNGDPNLFNTDQFRVLDHERAKGALELARRGLELACHLGREETP